MITYSGSYKFRDCFVISAIIKIDASQEKLWSIITEPGHLEKIHPFCESHMKARWDGVGCVDEAKFYSGTLVNREVVAWNEGASFQIKMINNEGHDTRVTFEIENVDEETYFKITIKTDAYRKGINLTWLFWVYLLLIPSYKKYFNSICKGLKFYSEKGQGVSRNQFGYHKIYSPKKNKIWYAFLDIGGKSDDDAITYYKNENFPFAKLLEDNYEVIKKEIQSYIEKNESTIKPYFNGSIITRPNSWRTFAFIKWGWKEKKNLKQCPQTKLILEKIPHLVSASISIMEPNIQIMPHRGDTNAVVRAHLPFVVPSPLPDCGFEVNKQKISWEEGKVFIFNDAALHSAWNNTDKRRYVMLLDVMRPKYVGNKNEVCSMVLGGLVMQSIFQKLPFVQRFPRFLHVIILYSHVGMINIFLRLRKVLGV
jgi:ornithine lipid ester-linked acyl 2-hydroxylase